MEKESSLGFVLAIISIILGLLSGLYFLLDSFIRSFLLFEQSKFFIIFIIPLIGATIGIISLILINRSKTKKGKRLAILGIILNSIAPVVIPLLLGLLFIIALKFGSIWG